MRQGRTLEDSVPDGGRARTKAAPGGARVFEAAGVDSVEALKALASETRVQVLARLADTDLNINELAQALGVSQPTMTRHINVLEAAGLVKSSYSSGAQGLQKRCRLVYDRLTFTFKATPPPEVFVEEMEMPVGLFSMASPTSPCGIADLKHHIGTQDLPQAFFMPERAGAQILWMADGFVEYVFANTLPVASEIRRLELSAEVCSECKNYDVDYPSDITVWVNGVEVGTWTSPGDMGGKRGRLNPEWWPHLGTQYGFLKTWAADEHGCSVDAAPVSRRTIRDLRVAPGETITVRLGVKPGAVHPGGFNLFGRGFGNHEQDVLLRLFYAPRRHEEDAPRTPPARARRDANGVRERSGAAL